MLQVEIAPPSQAPLNFFALFLTATLPPPPAENLTLALWGKKKFLSEINLLPFNFAYKKIKFFYQKFANLP
jgi:hypothetical protein